MGVLSLVVYVRTPTLLVVDDEVAVVDQDLGSGLDIANGAELETLNLRVGPTGVIQEPQQVGHLQPALDSFLVEPPQDVFPIAPGGLTLEETDHGPGA